MATSGLVNFSQTRDQLIQDALHDINVIPLEQEIPAATVNRANRMLNAMIMSWQADGLQLWKIKEAYLFLSASTRLYTVPGDRCTYSYVNTTLSADAAAAATSLTVTSITGINNGDNIGIVLDSGALQWTTVNGAPSGSIVTITAGLTSKASSGAVVFTYAATNLTPRPLDILEHNLVYSNGYRRPLNRYSRVEYQQITNPNTSGSATQIYFQPLRTTASIYLYPIESVLSNVVNFTGQFPIEYMNAATDDFDFPSEWMLALEFCLAELLCPAFGVPDRIVKEISGIAQREKQRVLNWDVEHETSIYLQPDYTGSEMK